MSTTDRKEALKIVHRELELMPNEDIVRTQKLCKAVLKSRTALESLQSELDEAAE